MERVKNYYYKIARQLFLLFSSNGVTKVFFELVSFRWMREIRTVSAGKRSYLLSRNLRSELVRNIHRIEKGLIMPNRRKIFALDYIHRTVDIFNILVEKDNSSPQLRWAHDVLHEYFKCIDSEQLEVSVDDITSLNSTGRIPMVSEARSHEIPHFDEFYSLLKRRRSIRFFQNRPVSTEIIQRCVEAASLGPSACNRQPFAYYIIQEEELRKKVASLPMGAGNWAKSAPVFIVVVGEFDHYFDVRDRHVPYIDSSLSVMSFILALETNGLSSCIINWPDIPKLERKMEKYLGLEGYQRPIMCIAIGYADLKSRFPFSEKKTAEELIKII